MAEPTTKKPKKTLDAFADDLDAMLNIGEAASEQVGLIDDDEAIDRLLVDHEVVAGSVAAERDEFADIDALLADEPARPDLELAADTLGDEFGEAIDINPKHEQMLDDEFADLVDIAAEAKLEELELEVEPFPDPDAADRAIEAIDDESEAVEIPELVVSDARDELEAMREIDEFSDAGAPGGNAEFLTADFDISADDEYVKPMATEPQIPAVAIDEFGDDDIADLAEGFELGAASAGVETPLAEPLADDDEFEMESAGRAPPADSTPEQPVPEPISVAASAPVVQMVDHSAEIAALTHQIDELKRHQRQIKADILEKAEKGQLATCLETVDGLQTEQKKTKRGLDAMANKKPVAAYVANGVAAVALLLGTGLGIQGMIAKSQVGELVTIIGKLQEQAANAPAANAAEQEMFRKQLDELSVGNGVLTAQITELKKSLAGGGGPSAGGDVGKQLAELGNRDMQIGAAIEALQAKVGALEKARPLAAATPAVKPEKKKPEPVPENWAVSLTAFKQDWYAKRKAEEFAGKGVPAKVAKSEAKGETWYRLSVDGFPSQYDAAAYAAKVKKTLNLDSVNVFRVKD